MYVHTIVILKLSAKSTQLSIVWLSFSVKHQSLPGRIGARLKSSRPRQPRSSDCFVPYKPYCCRAPISTNTWEFSDVSGLEKIMNSYEHMVQGLLSRKRTTQNCTSMFTVNSRL